MSVSAGNVCGSILSREEEKRFAFFLIMRVHMTEEDKMIPAIGHPLNLALETRQRSVN